MGHWVHLPPALLIFLFDVATQNFTKTGEPDSNRCDTVEQLQQRGCPENEIEFPVNEIKRMQDSAFSNKIQLTPQEVHLKLRISTIPMLLLITFCPSPHSAG